MLTINGPDGLCCHSHCFPLTVKELEIFTFSSHTSSNKILSLGLRWLNFQQKFRTEGVFRERRSTKQKRYWELESLFIACTMLWIRQHCSAQLLNNCETRSPEQKRRCSGEQRLCFFTAHFYFFFFLNTMWSLSCDSRTLLPDTQKRIFWAVKADLPC